MKFLVVLCALLGYANCQGNLHEHNITVLVEKGFARIDTNHDGVSNIAEMEALLKHDDSNGDGILTCDEFVAHTTAQKPLALQIFQHLEGDHPNCKLTHQEVLAFVAKMDTNGDGTVVAKEFEVFYVKMLKDIQHNLAAHHGHHGAGN